MRSFRWFPVATLALCAFALASCGKSTSLQSPLAGGGTSAATDEAQVAQALQEAPEFVQDGLTGDMEPMAFDPGGAFAAIRPFRFWRHIEDVQTQMQTEFLNPDPDGRPLLALVTIRRALRGTFNIQAGVVEGGDTSFSLVRKPLADQWTRRVALVRMPVPNDTGLTRWRMAGTSGVDVRTRGGATRIISLRIESMGLDTTITDPLELHRLRRVIRIEPDHEVRLTVTTVAPDDVVLFHHQDLRRRFVNHGDGTHSFRFPSGHFNGLRHLAVDALSRGTLFDDAAAYDSNAWALAYAVTPVRMPVGN